MYRNWLALFVAILANKTAKRSLLDMGIEYPAEECKEIKESYITGRPRRYKFEQNDLDDILYLRKNMTLREIANVYGVSVSTIARLIKKATKNPDQSVQSSIEKISTPLYHESRGVQVG